jgi:hypothetical protein
VAGADVTSTDSVAAGAASVGVGAASPARATEAQKTDRKEKAKRIVVILTSRKIPVFFF